MNTPATFMPILPLFMWFQFQFEIRNFNEKFLD